MKINIGRKSLLSALDTGAQMAGKNAIPELETVKIRIGDGKMLVTSFNGAVGVSTSAEINAGDDGGCVFLLVHERLAKVLGLIDDEIVTLETDGEGKTMTLTHDGGSMNIPLLPADKYPEFGKDEVTADTRYDGAVLSEWARLSAAFSANDELRPNLSGMYMYSENGEKGFCASDAISLITDSIRDTECRDFAVIIPRAALGPLAKSFSTAKTVRAFISERSVVFSAGGTSLYCQTVTGKYPAFKSIIPTECTGELYVGRKTLIQSLKRALVASDSSMHMIVMSAEDGRMDMEAQTPGSGLSAREACTCSAGTCARMGVNGEIFMTSANAVTGDKVKIAVIDPKKPIVLTGDSETRKIIVMPMQIR